MTMLLADGREHPGAPGPDEGGTAGRVLGFSNLDGQVYNRPATARIAVKGADVRASARAALLHPEALTILGVSLVLAIALTLLPALRPWSDRAVWVLLLGVAAYVAVVAVAYWSRPMSTAPEIRKLRTIRQGIATLLAERQAAPRARQDAVLIGVLADAIEHLDEHLGPALEELVERQARLRQHLARYERGELPAPESGVLKRLRTIFARQQAAIDGCVQQAANAYATLVALLQESDAANVAARARTWADGLLTLHDTLIEVLRGDDDPAQQQGAPPSAPDQDTPDAPAEPTAGVGRSEAPAEILTALVEQALRRVNVPARLTGSGLIARLPLTLAVARDAQRNGRRGDPTPLEQAQTLRQVLISAVERLKPAATTSGRGAGDMLYFVLDGLYLRGLSTRQIMTQCSISESTLHRYRREGIRVLAQELSEQEELLRRDEPDVAIG
jgi:hypothetical protein